MVEMNDELRAEIVEVIWSILEAPLRVDSDKVSILSHQLNVKEYEFRAEVPKQEFSSQEMNVLRQPTTVEYDGNTCEVSFEGIDTADSTNELVFTVTI